MMAAMRTRTAILSVLMPLLAAAPALSAPTADEAFDAGKQAFDAKDYAKAAESLSASIKLAPNFAKAIELRGEAYNALKQYDKAIPDFTAVLKADPKMDVALRERGVAEYALGKYQPAVDDITKYLAAHSDDEVALQTRGKAYEKLGKNDLAQKDLGKIDYAKALRNCRERLQDKKYDEAMPFANQAIGLDPNNPEGYAVRGEIYKQQKKLNEALADFKKDVELSPKNDPAPIYFVAWCYLNMGQPDKAAVECEKYNALKSDDAQAWFLQGNAYSDSKKYAEAIKAYDKACDLSGNNYLYLYYRGHAHRGAGNLDKALADVSKALEARPDEKWIVIERAIIYEKQGKSELANKDRQVAKDAGYPDWNNKD